MDISANDIKLLVSAEHTIGSVRQAQRANGALGGFNCLSSNILGLIHVAAAQVCQIFPGIESKIVIKLGQKFEEMCRRQQRPLENRQRLLVYACLLAELEVNRASVRQKGHNPKNASEKLIPVTVYNGPILPVLQDEFPCFIKASNIFYYVAVHSPFDPRTSLRQGQETIVNLAGDTEFKDFAAKPSILRHAAFRYSSDPHNYLRELRKTIAALATDTEFKDLSDRPGLFTRAAVHYPGKPRVFLRRQLLRIEK